MFSLTARTFCWLPLCLFITVSTSFAQRDTDGDGLVDLNDLGFFDPNMIGTGRFWNSGIEDLDGANQLTNLQFLHLSSNQITSIESGDFDDLANLEWLSLGFNQIASVERGDFNGLSNLQTLWLDSNPITSIESGDFDGLNNLSTLILWNTQITSIESGDFDGLNNLQTLSLWVHSKSSDTQITSIESGDFEGLNNLLTLDLRNHQITSIESGNFDGLNNLQELDLRENQIRSIESGGFNGLANLQSLHLSSNQITRIESGAFGGLNNLQSLLLFENEMTSIDFSRASFESLEPCEYWESGIGRSGFCIGRLTEPAAFPDGEFVIDREELTSLLLDNAQLSSTSFTAIVGETNSIKDVSIEGLTFTDANPENLEALLGIETLDNVKVDAHLYSLYQSEFDAFAMMEGNTLTVVTPDCNGDGEVNIFDANCTAGTELDSLLQDLGTILGDLDGIDGVQFPDFLIFSENFGADVASYTEGDLNVDGTVGFDDFLIFSENFGQVGTAAESVPEPSGVALLGMLMVCVGTCRQGRGSRNLQPVA